MAWIIMTNFIPVSSPKNSRDDATVCINGFDAKCETVNLPQKYWVENHSGKKKSVNVLPGDCRYFIKCKLIQDKDVSKYTGKGVQKTNFLIFNLSNTSSQTKI